jgi:glucosylceramidase
MKKSFLLLLVILIILPGCFNDQKITWISTTENDPWAQQVVEVAEHIEAPDIEVLLSDQQQTIEGFGTCFNELGWTSLNLLSNEDRESIMRELFEPGFGAGFNICRMPVGANDFSRKWYSYDETDGDFDMKNFSIANDLETLIPFIKNALEYNPSLKIWASPWSPPSWMKYNHHYACRSVLGNSDYQNDTYGIYMAGINNGLQPDHECKEGTDMFIQDEKYFEAYALYFSKFVQAYGEHGIKISMVMPQNEFNSVQVFPSCTWTAKGLARFITYLGPEMEALGVDVFFGTMEREDDRLVDTVLADPESGKYIKGVGFQWGGKGAISAVHQKYPDLTLYQSEQECGNGKNDWQYCVYTWSLMKHYLTSGANAYMYWNTSLKEGGISTWGWKQNSLVSVDTVNRTFKYNHEYYLMKHLSHFIKPGAKRLETAGPFEDVLAFLNPDGTVVLVLYNNSDSEKSISIKAGNRSFIPSFKPYSFNTMVFTL